MISVEPHMQHNIAQRDSKLEKFGPKENDSCSTPFAVILILEQLEQSLTVSLVSFSPDHWKLSFMPIHWHHVQVADVYLVNKTINGSIPSS